MTTTNTELQEVLNDLIKINYDRIEGYRNAGEQSKEHDISLHPVFQKLADDSRKNVSALTAHVRKIGGEAESGSTTMGKIYRTWMGIKNTFSGNDRTSILSSCEYGEDQAQKAYDEALASDVDMDTETRQLITSQKEVLKQGHDEIKNLRDASKGL